MKWMRNRELPTWAYRLGGLLIAFGCLMNVAEFFLLGTPLMCIGSWLMRWWFEVPVDHPRFQKISERRFRFYRNIMLICSWGMLILTVGVVFLSVVFGVFP